LQLGADVKFIIDFSPTATLLRLAQTMLHAVCSTSGLIVNLIRSPMTTFCAVSPQSRSPSQVASYLAAMMIGHVTFGTH
jgi:hypothetical protein